MKLCWSLLIFSIVLHHAFPRSTPASTSYKAAVVEYSPDIYNITGDVLKQNAAHYMDLIKEAAEKEVDIIVFPECGLATLHSSTQDSSFVPGPEDKANPCTNASLDVHEALRMLSCAAHDNNMYVVVNIPEKKSCASSRQDTCMLHYNTDVVFDPTGDIVARYRKFNLFGEPGFNITKEPDMTVFETDFGVKFGVFICFDIIFKKPAVSLVQELGITDIIFSTAWFSELPFLSAVQQQASWAYAMDVNFLGSGYNKPSVGSTGSGIYAGKLGPLISLMAHEATTQLLIADVPKKSTRANQVPSKTTKQTSASQSGLLMLKDYLNPYTTKLLATKDTAVKEKLCNGELCCDFDIKLRTTTTDVNGKYMYRLAVFDGVKSYTYKTGGIQDCAVIFCLGENLEQCGVSTNSSKAFSTAFDTIRISGDFRLENTTQFPNTLIKNYDVLSPQNFKFQRQEFPENNSVRVTMEILASESSLLTFGIYGRDYSKDGLPYTSNSNVVTLSLMSVGFALVLIVIVNKVLQHN